MGNYDEDHIYTWDYVMEQEAKCGWEKEHPDEKNPYENLPKVLMYTFDIAEQFRDKNYTDLLDKSFNFKEFFRTDDEGEFVHKQDVIKFLDNITSPDEKTNYPFSTQKIQRKFAAHALDPARSQRSQCFGKADEKTTRFLDSAIISLMSSKMTSQTTLKHQMPTI